MNPHKALIHHGTMRLWLGFHTKCQRSGYLEQFGISGSRRNDIQWKLGGHIERGIGSGQHPGPLRCFGTPWQNSHQPRNTQQSQEIRHVGESFGFRVHHGQWSAGQTEAWRPSSKGRLQQEQATGNILKLHNHLVHHGRLRMDLRMYQSQESDGSARVWDFHVRWDNNGVKRWQRLHRLQIVPRSEIRHIRQVRMRPLARMIEALTGMPNDGRIEQPTAQSIRQSEDLKYR